MLVVDFMTAKPHIIAEEETVFDAAKKIHMLGCGILPVGTYKKIVGVITDRDIVTRVISEGKNPTHVQVKEVMSLHPFFCNETDSIDTAVFVMTNHKVRRVLILNSERCLTGILSLGDIIHRVSDKRKLKQLFEAELVS